ncbi:MAG: hypothetical protein LBD58_01130 [Treponema sp.]|nr:hypothetical protein [Treponema sp.]
MEPAMEDERLVSMDTVDFPHPQNMKIEITGDQLGQEFLFPKELKSFKVWLEIACPKEMRSLVNPEKQLQRLIDNGATEGSRVTVRDISIETVRAAEITAVNSPVKKFET